MKWQALAMATGLLGAIALGDEAPANVLFADADDLADLSLEQLSDVFVTSVSRNPETLAHAPTSIYVITGDAIRRSGATSIPEALRLAPNLDIARADTNRYAISS